MTKTNNSTNRIRRIIAAMLTSLMMVSTATAISIKSASAATVPEAQTKTVAIVPTTKTIVIPIKGGKNGAESVAISGLFKGAESIVGVVTSSDPVAGIVASGLFGAFQTFYGESIQKPQATAQDVIDFLGELSQKMDQHFNEQTMQIKALTSIEKLQNMARILTSVKGYNEEAIGQIKLFNEKHICEQDYQNIIDVTSGDKDFVKDFRDLTNLISDGQAGIKGMPTFRQYLELSKEDDSNNRDAALVKKDCANFNQLLLEQYALYYTNLITGLKAEYDLAELQYKKGEIDLDTKNSRRASIKSKMDYYTDEAKIVGKQYLDISGTVNDLTVAKVTTAGKTIERFSMADAWAEIVLNGGTMQLCKNWNSDDLSSDLFFYKANDAFKGGSLYVKGKGVTLDLNGHSICESGARTQDIIAENAGLTITNTSSSPSALGGISVKGGSLDVNNVTVRNAKGSGIIINDSETNIKNCVFSHNSKSAVWADTANVNISMCKFDSNSSSAGGAVYFENGSSTKYRLLSILYSEFTNNSADNGGAVYCKGNTEFIGSTFTNNRAGNNGGAVCADYKGGDECAKIDISSSNFSGNYSGNNGGAVYCDSMNYLNLRDINVTNNEAKNAGGGVYAQKGSFSSCDPNLYGKITVIDNRLSNGTASNFFLGENTTSKCMFILSGAIDPNSRIGVTSPTSDKTLDILKTSSKDAYNSVANVFSYDTAAYTIHRYTNWYSPFYYVEIVKDNGSKQV